MRAYEKNVPRNRIKGIFLGKVVALLKWLLMTISKRCILFTYLYALFKSWKPFGRDELSPSPLLHIFAPWIGSWDLALHSCCKPVPHASLILGLDHFAPLHVCFHGEKNGE